MDTIKIGIYAGVGGVVAVALIISIVIAAFVVSSKMQVSLFGGLVDVEKNGRHTMARISSFLSLSCPQHVLSISMRAQNMPSTHTPTHLFHTKYITKDDNLLAFFF